ASLSSFVGGSPGNRATDHAQWQAAPYTEAELQRQIDLAPQFYGQAGVKLQRLLQAYVNGINAYIRQALLPTNIATMLPGEYAALGKLPQPWKGTDVVAEASLIGGFFGRGGGRELDSSLALQALQRRFGADQGYKTWFDFRSKNDPEAPTTVLGTEFPYQTSRPLSPRGLALPDPGSVEPAPVAPASAAASSAAGPFSNLGSQLMQTLGLGHASNWELVSARESQTGHPIGVLGPQVGYYLPQILMEEELHGPGFDAEGATFPGVNLFVLLGHGRDYAWSATTATADNVDTFAEVLCQDDFHYLYEGQCLAMDKLVRTNSWVPSAADPTPPGSETLTAYRTVHGIVYARGTVGGRKVAFVSARSTYGHEADSALFFQRMNDPQAIRSAADFREAAKLMNFAFNWAYLDSRQIAYQLSGWYPQRAKGTSPDFPVLGTGEFDWKGYDPSTFLADWLPQPSLPNATDQAYLVSWNNKQAPGWAAADDQYAYGPLHRSQMIADKVQRATAGSRKMTLAQLVQAMELPASQDLRGLNLLPTIFRAVGAPADPQLRDALARLRVWHKAGAFRRDLNRDGSYEMTPAIQLMDAWWPRLVTAQFMPALGNEGFERVRDMLALGDHTGTTPNPPDFFSGWWGYVSKDLRALYGPAPQGPYSRIYCGGGSPGACRAALRHSLREALTVTREQLYGHGECADDPQPSCFDRNASTNASGLSIEPQPFQNRPTFQQTVSINRDVPR
ncbi:MAG: penicillin acylase family protein, partial [Solirubrobacterales bacterium]